jgi:aspartokinase-like uncharacterized kinase
LVVTKDERPATKDDAIVDIVVKVGGGLLGAPAHFDAVLAAIAHASSASRILIVPGGGPFAETVRQVDREFGLTDDAAHWMAVLAMDQYAHLITSRVPRGALATDASEVAAAFSAALVPVLAISRWLRDADPLPHTWAVTSDSIAAWVASAVGARRLVLVKPPEARSRGAVDAYFDRALTAGVTSTVVPADDPGALRLALHV